MNIVQGYFGREKRPTKSLEDGDIVTIDTQSWLPEKLEELFFFSSKNEYLFPKLYGDSFEQFKLFLNSARWEVVLAAGENVEIKYLGPRIGESVKEEWFEQSFFVKARFLKKNV